MGLYGIRDLVFRSGRLVLNYDQLSVATGVPRVQMKVYASRLLKKGLATKVVDGVVAFTDDPFVIATQLVEPSYVSFLPSLYLRGLVTQVPNVVDCVTSRNSFKIGRLGLRYHRIVPPLFFGYERLERYGSYVFAALPEKAVLDLIYYGALPPLELQPLDRRVLHDVSAPYRSHGGTRSRRVLDWVRDYDN